MKKFDKGYIYSSMLSDLFGSLVILFVFLKDLFLEEDASLDGVLGVIPIFVGVFALIYLCFIVYRILYYKTSGYELTETEIKCNRGVLHRKRSVLEYKNVHAINKRQNIFHRICGVAVLTVDSGSTNTAYQAEITIVEKNKTVDLLLQKLNSLKENGAVSIDDIKEEEVLLSDKDSLYHFTSKRKMLYTLINILSTSFFTVLIGILAITVIGVCKFVLQLDSLGTWGEYFLYAFLITVLAMLAFSVVSLIASLVHSFVGYHKFTITKQGNNIQISYGLLEKHTNTFSYDRIKAVKITQDLVARMLGFATINLEVIGYTNDNGNEGADIGVLVPFCKYSEVGEILAKVLPDYIPDEKQTKAVSYFPFVSWFLLFFGIALGIILLTANTIMALVQASAFVFNIVVFCILGLGFIVLVLKLVSAFLAFKTNGIALNNKKITAYCGGFNKNVTVFGAKNLIAAENVTTPLRKKAGIVSLVMHLKTNALSNEVTVHIQKEELSEELEKLLIL